MHRSVRDVSPGIGRVRFLVALGLALVFAACGPVTVTLDELVADQDERVGQRLTVEGTVVAFEEPDGSISYVLEDDSHNRVLLPSSRADGHPGERVVVTGSFDFYPDVGRVLRVDEIRTSDGGGAGSPMRRPQWGRRIRRRLPAATTKPTTSAAGGRSHNSRVPPRGGGARTIHSP